ncbi:MAG: VOC family protein [Parvularculaceae bacterium]|nr:VOC family protein [Parvularculaceae bacterium]
MNRIHLHVYVEDMPEAVTFYTDLFGSKPTVTKDDYAKWLMDSPSMNFAISTKGQGKVGLSHLGIQVDERSDLSAITERLKYADRQYWEQKGQTCCYAVSDKTWATDPAGIKWESFVTDGESDTYYGVSGDEAEVEKTYTSDRVEQKRCCS